MIDKLYEITKQMGLSFTREEIVNLVENDICSNERSVIDYIILKNINDAFKDIENANEYLKRNVPTNIYYDVLKIFKEYTKS